MLNIKVTSSPDFSALSAMHFRCFAEGWNAQAFADLFAVSGTVAFIAQDNSGFGISRTLYDETEIITIGIIPASRKSGIGSAIIATILDQAKEQGVTTVFLEVGENNTAARRVYSKSGFTLLSTRKHYYHHADGSSENALVMRKVLISDLKPSGEENYCL